MRYWIVRGHTDSPKWFNDWQKVMAPGARGTWHTKRPPKAWSSGDRLFFYALAPASEMMGLGVLENVEPGESGETDFQVTYLTAPFARPIKREVFERNADAADSHFLKNGPTQAVLSLNEKQAKAIFAEVVVANPQVRSVWRELAT